MSSIHEKIKGQAQRITFQLKPPHICCYKYQVDDDDDIFVKEEKHNFVDQSLNDELKNNVTYEIDLHEYIDVKNEDPNKTSTYDASVCQDGIDKVDDEGLIKIDKHDMFVEALSPVVDDSDDEQEDEVS